MLTLNTKRPNRLWLVVTLVFIALVVIAVVSYALIMMNLPLPEPVVTKKIQTSKIDTGKPAEIAWSDSQQAALGAVGNEVVAVSYKDEKSLPIASVAKIITALAVLKQKPLNLDEQGPTLTLGSADVALYNSYKAIGGSVVKVTSGEQISQYQAMQAMLIPSANNMAASLAGWAFGSEAKYAEYANKMVADLGLSSTHVEDASGISPKTVSSARDLVLLGKEALKNPVIAQIVSQTEATIPVAGKIQTTNEVMGQAGINGMKTGHTNESGGCFLFTAKHTNEGKEVTVVGAIVAAPSIDEARAAAPLLVEQGLANLVAVSVLETGTLVGTLHVPWASPMPITAEKGLSQIVWRGTDTSLQLSINPAYEAGQVGVAQLGADTTKLVLKDSLPQPDIWWRLSHPMELLEAR